MNNNINFYLARHGQTQWNIEQRIQGQLDSVLTEVGKKQALQLAQQCTKLDITHILTSPLGRALDTANICAQHLQIAVHKVTGFEERHFGDWQGRLVSEMKTDPNYMEITSQITDCKPNQGESAKQLLTRFQKALIEALKAAPNETHLIISHGDILRCFMANLGQSNQALPEPSSSLPLLAETLPNPVLCNGYDYENAQLIALNYNFNSGLFSRL